MKKIELGIPLSNLRGFSSNEMQQMQKFLWNYEEHLKKLKTDDELKVLFPPPEIVLFGVLSSMIVDDEVERRNIPKTEDELGDFDVICTKHYTKNLSIIYHLRNAIAHSTISKDVTYPFYVHFSDKIQIKNDETGQNEEFQTAIGRISGFDFEKILSFLSSNIEQQ